MRDLDLLSVEERARLLSEWNATGHAVPGETVPDLFEAQVRRTPDAVALVHGDEMVSYAELNRRANRLAHALIGRGIGPESVVGIALPRSVSMVVSVLGVLKAGERTCRWTRNTRRTGWAPWCRMRDRSA